MLNQKLTLKNSTEIYSELYKTVSKQGTLDRSYGYYAILTIIIFGGFL